MVQQCFVMAGVGGQGIQVSVELLGVAATAAGMYCLEYHEYGGSMRGGKSSATLTVGHEPIDGTAQAASVDAGVLMHPGLFDHVSGLTRPGGFIIANSSLIAEDSAERRPDIAWLFAPFSDMGEEIGQRMAASMIALGVLCSEMSLLDAAILKSTLPHVLPEYRHHHIPIDEKAIDLGFALTGSERLVRLGSSDVRGAFELVEA